MGEAVNAPELDARARRIILIVALLNLAGCLGEAILAFAIGSASLLADAADFLEDFLINSLVLLALAWPLESRRKASYALAGLILIPAGAAFAMAIHKLLTGLPPEPFALSGTALAALVINACCAVLLVAYARVTTLSCAAHGSPPAMMCSRTSSSLRRAFSPSCGIRFSPTSQWASSLGSSISVRQKRCSSRLERRSRSWRLRALVGVTEWLIGSLRARGSPANARVSGPSFEDCA